MLRKKIVSLLLLVVFVVSTLFANFTIAWASSATYYLNNNFNWVGQTSGSGGTTPALSSTIPKSVGTFAYDLECKTPENKMVDVSGTMKYIAPWIYLYDGSTSLLQIQMYSSSFLVYTTAGAVNTTAGLLTPDTAYCFRYIVDLANGNYEIYYGTTWDSLSALTSTDANVSIGSTGEKNKYAFNGAVTTGVTKYRLGGSTAVNQTLYTGYAKMYTGQNVPTGTAPIASGVGIDGDSAIIGTPVVGHYTYSDIDDQATSNEGASIYKWYLSDLANPADPQTATYTQIAGATAKTYDLLTSQLNHYIKFSVTPVSKIEPFAGQEVIGMPIKVTQVNPSDPTAPVAKNVAITPSYNNPMVGDVLTGAYSYSDSNSDSEANSEYRWLSCDTENGTYSEISNQTNNTYTLLASDYGKYIKFQVTPKTTVEPSVGLTVLSNALYYKPLTTYDDLNFNWQPQNHGSSGSAFPTYVPIAERKVVYDLEFETRELDCDTNTQSFGEWGIYSWERAYATPTNGTLLDGSILGTQFKINGKDSLNSTVVTGLTPNTRYNMKILIDMTPANQTTITPSTYQIYIGKLGEPLKKWSSGGKDTFVCKVTTTNQYGVKYFRFGNTSAPSTRYVNVGALKLYSASGIPPVATNVNISGTLEAGQVLTANYTQINLGSGQTLPADCVWYKSKGNGAPYYMINGANSNTYTIKDIDVNQDIKVVVTPKTSIFPVEGLPIESSSVHILGDLDPALVPTYIQNPGLIYDSYTNALAVQGSNNFYFMYSAKGTNNFIAMNKDTLVTDLKTPDGLGSMNTRDMNVSNTYDIVKAFKAPFGGNITITSPSASSVSSGSANVKIFKNNEVIWPLPAGTLTTAGGFSPTNITVDVNPLDMIYFVASNDVATNATLRWYQRITYNTMTYYSDTNPYGIGYNEKLYASYPKHIYGVEGGVAYDDTLQVARLAGKISLSVDGVLDGDDMTLSDAATLKDPGAGLVVTTATPSKEILVKFKDTYTGSRSIKDMSFIFDGPRPYSTNDDGRFYNIEIAVSKTSAPTVFTTIFSKENKSIPDQSYGRINLTDFENKILDVDTIKIIVKRAGAYRTTLRELNIDMVDDSTNDATIAAKRLEIERKIMLPSLIANDMLVQQGRPIRVYGYKGGNGNIITVSMNGNSATAVVDNGKWSCELPAMVAGGPYTMTISSDYSSITLNNILVGELWAFTGQSNMRRTVGEMGNYTAAALPTSTMDKIRLFYVDNCYQFSNVPEDDVQGHWGIATIDNARAFAAVGWGTLKDLYANLNIPVGGMYMAMGGQVMSAWNKDSNGNTTTFYNASWNPLFNVNIRGIGLYQGEGDRTNTSYSDSIATFVSQSRANFRDANLPLIMVQLPVICPSTGYNYVWMRNTQLKIALTQPGVGLVTSIDLPPEPGDDPVHPANKSQIGPRMARTALAQVYGKNIAYVGPIFKQMDVVGNKAVIKFTNVGSGLVSSDGQPINDFKIAGADGVFYDGTVTITGADTIEVVSNNVATPTKVYYVDETLFKNTDGTYFQPPRTNLFGGDTIPVMPFKSDWDLTVGDGIKPKYSISNLNLNLYENDYLPQKVTVTQADGTVTENAVSWYKVNSDNTSIGSNKISGNVEGLSLIATADVNVNKRYTLNIVNGENVLSDAQALAPGQTNVNFVFGNLVNSYKDKELSFVIALYNKSDNKLVDIQVKKVIVDVATNIVNLSLDKVIGDDYSNYKLKILSLDGLKPVCKVKGF